MGPKEEFSLIGMSGSVSDLKRQPVMRAYAIVGRARETLRGVLEQLAYDRMRIDSRANDTCLPPSTGASDLGGWE